MTPKTPSTSTSLRDHLLSSSPGPASAWSP
ncbi:hypothetical protein IEO21_10162 [Rhodonia placenta]|uniref:Uncharacterized protein n=1 Tax=Rhodonia placenta TaxID=104341 RepID=A0A8H7TXP4_9APHY|nr:hypothetical protein IEO21_10162 [Postia placenta]